MKPQPRSNRGRKRKGPLAPDNAVYSDVENPDTRPILVNSSNDVIPDVHTVNNVNGVVPTVNTEVQDATIFMNSAESTVPVTNGGARQMMDNSDDIGINSSNVTVSKDVADMDVHAPLHKRLMQSNQRSPNKRTRFEMGCSPNKRTRLDTTSRTENIILSLAEKVERIENRLSTLLETNNSGKSGLVCQYQLDDDLMIDAGTVNGMINAKSYSGNNGRPSVFSSALDEAPSSDFSQYENSASSSFGSSYLYAPRLGDTLPLSLKLKIWSHKYVDFRDLISLEMPQTQTLMFNQNSIVLQAFKRKPLSFKDWECAWRLYFATYVSRYGNDTQAMIAYSSSLNWAFYDEQFRRGRESKRYPWDTVRPDLDRKVAIMGRAYAEPAVLNKAQLNNQRNHSFREGSAQGNHSNQPFREQGEFSQSYQAQFQLRVPKGFCVAYHTKGKQCRFGDNCVYQHKCFTCFKLHPSFMCSEPDTEKNTSVSTDKGKSSQQE